MSIEGKYHLSENGPNVCHARVQECPVKKKDPNAIHYNTFEEALVAYDKKQGTKHLDGRRKNNRSRMDHRNRNPRRRKEELVRGEPVFKFHKETGFPPGLVDKYENIVVDLEWTHHAKEAAAGEEYGAVSKLTKLDTRGWELVEVKANKKDMQVRRLLYRSQPDEHGVSQCFVVEVEPRKGKPWRVVTVWKNEAWDTHATLNKDNYYTPEEAKEEQTKIKDAAPVSGSNEVAKPPTGAQESRRGLPIPPGGIPKPGPKPVPPVSVKPIPGAKPGPPKPGLPKPGPSKTAATPLSIPKPRPPLTK